MTVKKIAIILMRGTHSMISNIFHLVVFFSETRSYNAIPRQSPTQNIKTTRLVSVVHCKKICIWTITRLTVYGLIKVQLREEQNQCYLQVIIISSESSKNASASRSSKFFYDHLSFIPKLYTILYVLTLK